MRPSCRPGHARPRGLAAPERLVRLRLQILARHADVTQLPAVEALELAAQARPLPMPPDKGLETFKVPSRSATDRHHYGRIASDLRSDFTNTFFSIQ